MEKYSRSQRISDSKRLKRNRQNYWSTSPKNPVQMGLLLNTPAICSCPMCGNPRKYFKGKDALTLQERKFYQLDKSWEFEGYLFQEKLFRGN